MNWYRFAWTEQKLSAIRWIDDRIWKFNRYHSLLFPINLLYFTNSLDTVAFMFVCQCNIVNDWFGNVSNIAKLEGFSNYLFCKHSNDSKIFFNTTHFPNGKNHFMIDFLRQMKKRQHLFIPNVRTIFFFNNILHCEKNPLNSFAWIILLIDLKQTRKKIATALVISF